jgi:hypothetical protein
VPASPALTGLPAAEGFYMVDSGPGGEGFTPVSRTKAAAALSADTAAFAANVPADSDQVSAKRTAKARQHARKYRFEYLDEDGRMASSPGPPAAEPITASDGGAGTLGFAGTIPNPAAAQAQGLGHLRGGDFGEAAQQPMLPNTWDISD